MYGLVIAFALRAFLSLRALALLLGIVFVALLVLVLAVFSLSVAVFIGLTGFHVIVFFFLALFISLFSVAILCLCVGIIPESDSSQRKTINAIKTDSKRTFAQREDRTRRQALRAARLETCKAGVHTK
jgi:Zn-dependent membrane protease YugP